MSRAMSDKLSPFMAQYMEIKAEHPDALLFFRMGDFYELFFKDAEDAAAALDITLTARGQHGGDPIPMAGVPHHAADSYLSRLIRLGFRVAVCEQLEDPAEAKKRGSKAVVKRGVVRIVTPGTLTEDSLLDARSANTLAALAVMGDGESAAIVTADVSTGQFDVYPCSQEDIGERLSSVSPREIIVSDNVMARPFIAELLETLEAPVTPRPSIKSDAKSGERLLKQAYEVSSLDAFGGFSRAELSASALLLDYLELTQAGQTPRLDPPRHRAASAFMAIDQATRASLEIEKTVRGGKQGSLLSTIDRTVTAPGARLLGEQVSRPLLDIDAINNRLDAVAWFQNEATVREDVRAALKQAADVERARMRLALGRGGPKDLLALMRGLKTGEQIAALMSTVLGGTPKLLVEACRALSLVDKPGVSEFARKLEAAIKEDPSALARDGGFINEGYDPSLDEARNLRDDSRKIIAGLQAQYSEQTGVQSLKIRHNKVLGYFIDVTARNASAVQESQNGVEFIHRQTLANAVRFTTTELGDLDGRIARADEEAKARELELFDAFVGEAENLSVELKHVGDALAAIDVAAANAEWADEVRAVRPELTDDTSFVAKGVRHPVVEASLRNDGQGFTANDCVLDAGDATNARLLMVTGPNMAGKSTYLRQNALLAIMAQAGCFVPAESFKLGIVDRVFSRVGASDDLARGRSTFMVEMIETAAILNQSGPRAFVILDEVGRGTATYDGLAIAWAAAEHLHDINKCRAIFATHYHELTDLAEKLPGAANASLRAKDWKGELVFLHDVQPGPADKSYGVQVAKLAGLPKAAVKRAEAVLKTLESEGGAKNAAVEDLPLFAAIIEEDDASGVESEIEDRLRALDIDDLSPRQALETLYALKDALSE